MRPGDEAATNALGATLLDQAQSFAATDDLEKAREAAAAALTTLPADEARLLEVQTSHDVTLGVVRLEIADNGPGVSAEARLRMFEPYFSTKPEGTGLGLAIVSATMADHKGFVRVRDNPPRGSRFVLEFPVRPAHLVARTPLGAYGTG